MAGVGTSKEDKRRKRRSLPHEKKRMSEAEKRIRQARAKYRKYEKRGLSSITKLGKATGRTLANVLKKKNKKD
jgi:hypothetical protein